MENKYKSDRIHDQMPRYYQTRTNPNWRALIETLGESDQNIADLVEEVKKQFFVKTAYRPYIDTLGANLSISRPGQIGMDDTTFRRYIPILAYQPKQVKHILDLLLDVFFFKETTTAFTISEAAAPYTLVDGWELTYFVDQIKQENIIFKNADFVSISAATAEEIASVINKQALYSFAIPFDDRIKKQKVVKIFTNTIGSKGSIQIIGGRADLALKFRGFIEDAGNQPDTQWNVTKIGDTVTFQHVGGNTPNINKTQVGDTVIINLVVNSGSFTIESIDLSTNSFSFTNIFSTVASYDHALLPATNQVKFMTPEKIVVYTNNIRSLVWEVSPGEIIVEMPATPPVVKRSLAGSAHLNGLVGVAVDTPSLSSLEIDDASEWPLQGQFVYQPLNEIQTHILTISEDEEMSHTFNGRFNIYDKYQYTGKSGNTLTGITPPLPEIADIFEYNIVTATRTSPDIVTVVTATTHSFAVNEIVRVQNTVGGPTAPVNGTFIITEIVSPTSFRYLSLGDAGTATNGICRVERIGVSNSGGFAYLTSAQLETGILGAYMWDRSAAYVLSSLTSNIQQEIKAGNIVRSLQINPVNNIPNQEGYVIFDFGTDKEEGPVRYLYKPTTASMQLDPSYIFKNNHDINSAVTVIRRRGAHVMSGLATEYPAYITDPAVARETLQGLMQQVKSVGIFMEFLIRYPAQLYATLDIYRSGSEELWPVNQEVI